MASSTKLGAWRWTSVRVQRTGRRTHHVHPITSLVMNRCRAARVGNFGRSRENLRDMAHRALSRAERMLSSAGRGRRRKAPSISPQLRPAAACRPARLPCDPPTRAAPPQRHGRRRMTAARTAAAAQERRRAPDAMLRRQLSHEPYPSAPPPCARVPSGRHAQPSAEPAGGSQLPPPPPPTRGAAAPSSLVLPLISPVISTARGT